MTNGQTNRSRLPIVALMLAGLVISGTGRTLASRSREKGAVQAGQGAAASIGRFDSYTLALLLGGLRGPLVMMLWATSEAQKSERNLEDFDTKVEWIRLLQPEFDTVHIFQIWNKAYNVSVQMVALPNKYLTILDALKYAEDMDAERPDNINILVAEAQIYENKLGGSNEKDYYRKRVREDSIESASGKRRRAGLEPIVDTSGKVLPKWLTPRMGAAEETEAGGVSPLLKPPTQALNGSKLQFLKAFEPFPQGVSPMALGYNYYKRAQLLQSSGRQKHLQLAEMVVDSRPALCLKGWSEEEFERGRRFEMAGYGIPVPKERLQMEMPTAAVNLAIPVKDAAELQRAIFCYDKSLQVGEESLREYAAHLKEFPASFNTYRAHQDQIRAFNAASLADASYLRALATKDAAEQKNLFQTAADAYLKSSDYFGLLVVQHYIDEKVTAPAFPPDVTPFNLTYDPAKPGLITQIAMTADELMEKLENDEHREDRGEYVQYMHRNITRLQQLGALGVGPSAGPHDVK